MKHRRGIDLLDNDPVSAPSVGEILSAAEAAKRLSFADVPECYQIFACCQPCGHARAVNRYQLQRDVGADALVVETATRLRCTKCGVRGGSRFMLRRMPR